MRGRWGRRRLLLGSCLAAVMGVAAPGTAYAVDNLPPKQPLVGDLQNNFKPCATGAEPLYVTRPEVLTAVLSDPAEDDRLGYPDRLTGEFELWWTDAAGIEQRRSLTTSSQYSGQLHRVSTPADIPADTVISWHVRADDGTTKGAWSSEAPGAACRFVWDDDPPAAPTVSSPEYPKDTFRVGGVGVYGSFTMDSASPDVVAYRYSFSGGPYGATARPSEPGGAATIRFVPLNMGPQTLTVEARDRSGWLSATTNYTFYPNPPSAPVSRWTLADATGSTTAVAETGKPAQAGKGVTFGGPAPSGTPLTATATLDGSSHAYLTTDTPAVDTGGTFAVGAWVRPAETGRPMTVAGQDATAGAVYALGLDAPETGAPAWSFSIGDATVRGGAPETGEWAYLLGLYDAETGRARLYVNGHEVGSAVEATPAAASGAFQIGRILTEHGYKHRWNGDIGDVRAYDRLVVPDEVTELPHRKGWQLGHWSFSTATDGLTPENNGGAPLRLSAGASIFPVPDNSCVPEPDIDPDCRWKPYPLAGDGNLALDGESGHAALDGPLVDTGDSFTIGVVARIQEADATRPMTVLSQAGEHTDGFRLRYEPSTYAWQLVVPERDEAGAPEKVVAQIAGPAGDSGNGIRLVIVYDDATDTIRLYADGNTNAQATAHLPNGWQSTGPFQVGRGHTADGWGEYFKGDIDEIHAFSGALRERDIPQLGHESDPCLCY
ncbi:LamG-like jellyroll fold domain-containing protein [Streptomyces sp. NPDC012769]|uniref:LamG domain-containing protein n=1 Tax=Streptomyces sp. NPDC012769 TaxID=3364848 RepID=UPI0036D1EEAC